MNMYEKRVRLKELIAQHNAVPMVAAFDVISAKLIEKTGFPIVYTGSYVTSATQFGISDTGLITLNEMLELSRRIANETNIPIVVDCDTGWYHAANIWRTVHEFESAGISGIHIEDGIIGKHTGFPGLNLETEVMCDRIRACCDARKDKNFVIIARTNTAIHGGGFEEAVARCNAYLEAGADAVFLDHVSPHAVFKKYRPLINGPVVICNGEEPMSAEKDCGADLVVYWGVTIYAAFHAMKKCLEILRDTQDCTQLGEYRFNEKEINTVLPFGLFTENVHKYNLKDDIYKRYAK